MGQKLPRVPVGEVWEIIQAMPTPRNWLKANGARVSKAEFPELNRHIGCCCRGETTFPLPDLCSGDPAWCQVGDFIIKARP